MSPSSYKRGFASTGTIRGPFASTRTGGPSAQLLPPFLHSNRVRWTQTTVLTRNRLRGLKQGKAGNSLQDGSAGMWMATAPHLLEVTLWVSADGRFAGDDIAVAAAVLARIRLPNCVILQITVSLKLDPQSTRRVLFYTQQSAEIAQQRLTGRGRSAPVHPSLPQLWCWGLSDSRLAAHRQVNIQLR